MKRVQQKAQSIAIVDDDEDVRSAVNTVLKSAGFVPRSFASAAEFLAFGEQSETVCLIADVKMPGMNGLELQSRLAEDGRQIPIIFITAYGDTKTRMRALGAGAVDFLEKPFHGSVLLDRIGAARNITQTTKSFERI